jgi:hypothetical protein
MITKRPAAITTGITTAAGGGPDMGYLLQVFLLPSQRKTCVLRAPARRVISRAGLVTS